MRPGRVNRGAVPDGDGVRSFAGPRADDVTGLLAEVVRQLRRIADALEALGAKEWHGE